MGFLDMVDQPRHLYKALVTIIRETLIKRIAALVLMNPIDMLVILKLVQKLLRALSLVDFLVTFLF